MKARDVIPGWPRPRSTTRADYTPRADSIWQAVYREKVKDAKERKRALSEMEARLCFLALQCGLRLRGARWRHEFHLRLESYNRAWLGFWIGWFTVDNGHEEFQVRKTGAQKMPQIICLPSGDLLSGWPGSLFADKGWPGAISPKNAGDGSTSEVDLPTLL